MAATTTVQTLAGLAMPRLIYGTAWKKERTASLVVAAVRCGFRAIDTACQPKHYAERLVGEALATLAAEGIAREHLFVQTKYTPFDGQDPRSCPYDSRLPLAQQVAKSVAVSLSNLQSSYIDSLVLHSPLRTHEETMTVWRAFEDAVAAGQVRQLGISNCYDLARLKQVGRTSCVQRFEPRHDFE